MGAVLGMLGLLCLSVAEARAGDGDIADGAFRARIEAKGSSCVEFPVEEATSPCTGAVGAQAAAAMPPDVEMIRILLGQYDDWRYIVTVTRAAPIAELSEPGAAELMRSLRAGAREAAGLPASRPDDAPPTESHAHGIQVLRSAFDVGFAPEAPARAVGGHAIALAAVTGDGLYMVVFTGPPEHAEELGALADRFAATIEGSPPPKAPLSVADLSYYLGYSCTMVALIGLPLAFVAAAMRGRSAPEAR